MPPGRAALACAPNGGVACSVYGQRSGFCPEVHVGDAKYL
jgi:hypothetical protein